VVHLELHTRDVARARELYAGLLDWRPRELDLPGRAYAGYDLGPGLGGGVVQCATGRALWLPYVEVPDVHAATERARALGAHVLLEPGDGRRAVIGTRAGGEIALWQPRG
jgi:uncharacterized protein